MYCVDYEKHCTMGERHRLQGQVWIRGKRQFIQCKEVECLDIFWGSGNELSSFKNRLNNLRYKCN